MANQENLNTGNTGSRRGPPSDDSIARLMRLAGPRPGVPTEVQERVHAAVEREWRSAVKRRRVVRWGIPAALAATVLVVVALNSRGPTVELAPIATIASSHDVPVSRFASGDVVYPGDTIETSAGGVSLLVSTGLSLRIAPATILTLDAVDQATLASGRVYADSGLSAKDDLAITVHTALGSASDVGTRFAVSFLGGDMSVAVREGKVDVIADRGSFTAGAGDMLTLRPDDVVFGTISPYDSAWAWATELAPSFDIENRTLLDFLEWAARETGKELVFGSDEARARARDTRLRGSVADFSPDEAMASVLPTTRFDHHVDERRILIKLPGR